MKITTRVLIAFAALYIVGFWYVIDLVVNEIRPRYLETVEESMNDTANLLAALIESSTRGADPATALVERMFDGVRGRTLSSRIYALHKTDISLDVYITDARGIVRYDSRTPSAVGMDYSRWNDVYRTLRGGYGARSSQRSADDKSTNALYVAAPLRRDGAVIGVVTVIKPERSVKLFMDMARRKIIIAGILTAGAFILVSVGLSYWIHRPLRALVAYVQSLAAGDRRPLPRLGAPEVRELGQAFLTLKNELEGKQYIERYITSLTHELKSPLTSIRASAELLCDADLPANRQRQFSATIVREALRIEVVIQNLLRLSMVENRDRPLEIELLSPRDEIDRITQGLAAQIAEKQIVMRNAIDAACRVPGERFLVHHALNNLVVNAIQFSRPDGRITAVADCDEHVVRISIVDEGEGIPDFARERIFERFYSVAPSGTHHKGSGLGLPFVRQVATLHGGWADVVSNPGGGATATLCLPRRPHPAE